MATLELKLKLLRFHPPWGTLWAYGIRYYLGFGLYRVQVLLHRSSVFLVELIMLVGVSCGCLQGCLRSHGWVKDFLEGSDPMVK